MDDTAITLQSYVVAAPSATSAQLEDEVVVLDVAQSQYFGLGEVGARVWKCIESGGTTVAAMKTQLIDTYDVAPDHIERDLMALLHQLHARGLILIDPSEAELEAARAKAAGDDKSSAASSEAATAQALGELRVLRDQERIRQQGPRWWRPVGDWWMLLCAMGLTVCIRLALSVWSLRQVTQAIRRIASHLPRLGTATPAYRRRAAWAANAVGHRFLPNRPCLTQALVLQYLLLRRGDDRSELHIGVAKGKEGELLAHAWIERNGRILIGGTASPHKYQRLDGIAQKVAAP